MDWGEWLKGVIKDISEDYVLSENKAKLLLKKILKNLKKKSEREEQKDGIF